MTDPLDPVVSTPEQRDAEFDALVAALANLSSAQRAELAAYAEQACLDVRPRLSE